ncbi:MAG TPA: alpha-amylase family glycosyl hydrolase [Saprospiraceae bacterium]|nr:alpha-amylase family glycosyl hydrolase [Saprospiraceae bacterium]
MGKYHLYFFIFLMSVYGCKSDHLQTGKNYEYQGLSWPEWAINANIYEVNIRQYTDEGSFKAFTNHIPRLKEMGVDILWLMPVFPISETKKKGSLGSYYAVSNYTAVNPEFGTIEDFRALVNTATAYEMKIILDWVPNHTGWDHIWITENPDFYTVDQDGNITDPIQPETGESWGWTDVADLNYDNIEMRQQMIDAMLYWVNEENIMGFRQDVAGEVPLDFWKEATSALLQANPNLFLLAEAQKPEHFDHQVFHAGYGWDFHHILNDVAKGEKNADDIFEWLTNEKPKYKNGTLMHFTSNHDENSWQGTEFERMGSLASSMAIITHTIDGIPLIYSGQEEPLRRRLEFFEKDNIAFNRFAYENFYKKLNELKHKNRALWNGPYGGVTQRWLGRPDVLAYLRQSNGDQIIVMVNLSDKAAKIQISENVSGFMDVFTGNEIQIEKDEMYVLHKNSFALWSNR